MGIRWAVRDTAVLIVAIGAWSFALASGGEESVSWQIAAGVLGGMCGYFAHEWGHLLGAALSGSRFAFSPSLASPFLFRFDTEASSRQQFLAMSLSGFAASLVVLGLLLGFLPLGLLATRITLGVVLGGLALTLFIEVPLLVHVMRGGRAPRATVFTLPD